MIVKINHKICNFHKFMIFEDNTEQKCTNFNVDNIEVWTPNQGEMCPVCLNTAWHSDNTLVRVSILRNVREVVLRGVCHSLNEFSSVCQTMFEIGTRNTLSAAKWPWKWKTQRGKVTRWQKRTLSQGSFYGNWVLQYFLLWYGTAQYACDVCET